MRKEDVSGSKFGRLSVVRRAENKGKKTAWECRCECGEMTVVTTTHLKRGSTISCGCLRIEVGLLKRTHGMSKSKPYRVWAGMIHRCHNANSTSYERYGGRGISVCERWKRFENFWEDMKDGYAEHLEIERKDNNAGYSPQNCKWATPLEQGSNKRNNVLYTLNGVTKSEARWAASLGITHTALHKRINSGWPMEMALTTPRSLRGKKNRWTTYQSGEQPPKEGPRHSGGGTGSR